MSWSKAPASSDAPEVIYTSTAVTPHVLVCDLWCVLYRMRERRAADHASAGVGVHLFTQVADRSIALRWVDKDLQGIGDWTYTLKLEALFQASLDADDAADEFEDTVGCAVSWFVEDQDDLVAGEPVAEGQRPGLRPISSEDGLHYNHPAYTRPMSKTSPVNIYWSSAMSPEIELL